MNAGSITVALAALLLAACGKAENAATSAQDASSWPSFEKSAAMAEQAPRAPLPRACDLLSAEDVEAVLQLDAGLMADDPENCMWSGSAGVGSITMLMLQVSQLDDIETAQQVFNGVAGQQGNLSGTINRQVGEKTRKSGREFDGLGDEAWLSSANVGGGFGNHQVVAQQLVVRKGTRLLTLNVTGSDKSGKDLGERMEALARGIAPKL